MAGTVEATVKATVEIDSAQAKKAADDLANALIELKYEADKLNKESIISNEDIQRLDALKLKFSELSQSEQLASRDAELIYGHYTKLIDTLESLNLRNQVGQPGYLYDLLFSKKEELKVDEEINAENKKKWELMEQIRNEYAEQVRLENQLNGTTQDKIEKNVDLKDEVEKANIDYDQLANTLIRLTGASNGAGGSILSIGKALGVNIGAIAPFALAIGGGITAIVKLKKELDDMLGTFDKVAKTIGTGTINGLDNFIDGLKTIADTVEQVMQRIDELSESGIDLERAFLTTSAYLGSDATNEIYDFMNSITGASNTMFKSINDVVAAAGSMGLASEDLVTATENMTVMGRNMGVLIGDTEKAFKDLGQVISKGYVGRDNLLYRIFTKEEIKRVKELTSEVDRYNFVMERANRVQDLYNEYIQTASGKVTLMKMQYQEFMTNIGTVALQLYAIVAPILTKILTLANGVLSAIINVFGWAPKAVGFESVADKIAGSMGKVGGAASKSQKQVASFDDVIQINDSKSGGGGAGGFDTEGLKDFSSILDDALGKTDDLTDKWKHFKELLAAGDYKGAGSELMKIIYDDLSKIDWDALSDKWKRGAKSLADFINGMTDLSNDDVVLAWGKIGESAGKAINLIIEAAKTFISNLSFGSLGQALGIAWNSFWTTLDVESAAKTVYWAIMGIFSFIAGWLEQGGFGALALAFKRFVEKLFSSFTDSDTANILKVATNLINNILNSLLIAEQSITTGDTKEILMGIIEKAATAFKENAGEWGMKLNTIITDVLKFLIEAIRTADKSGLTEGINSFFENLHLEQILFQWLYLKLQIALHKLQVNGWLLDAVAKVIESILAFAGGLLLAGLDKLGGTIWDKITSIFTKKSASVNVNVNTDTSKKFKVPRLQLAEGGVVSQATRALIGEAGPEAVIPLKKNAEWMRALASEIAGQMGTTGAGGTVKVSLSDKPFYTKAEMYEFAELIVKSLKVYGLNVAIV